MKLGKTSILLGLLSLIYWFCAVIYKVSFANFFALFGILLILFGLIKLFIKPEVLEKFKYLILSFKILIIIMLISFFSIEGMIVHNGMKNETNPCDYIVILGAMVRGETPTMILKERLDTAF